MGSSLGAYSVVRYSNTLNDQRVNLGVILWHPRDGFRFKFSAALQRAHVIDLHAVTDDIRAKLEVIKKELHDTSAGSETLIRLSQWFKDGLEVATPYPARVSSADEMMERLYSLIVSADPEFRRASSQQRFDSSLRKTLSVAGKSRGAKVQDLGSRRFGDLMIYVGISTTRDSRKALWRALSLQAIDRVDRQLAYAKATAMDVNVLKGVSEFKGHRQYVTVLEPRPQARHRLRDSIAWLEREADGVFVVRDADALPKIVEKVLV